MVPTPREVLRDLRLPAVLFGVVALGGAWLGNELDRQAATIFQLGIDQTGESQAWAIEGHARNQLRGLEVIGDEFVSRGLEGELVDPEAGLNEEAILPGLARASALVMSWFPGFQAINWVGTDGTIELVWPLEGNREAQGKNLLEHDDPGVRQAVQRALSATGRHDSKVELSPLIRLYQGPFGFSAYHATFAEGGEQLGLLNAAFRADALIQASLGDDQRWARTDLVVRGPDGESLYPPDGPAFGAGPEFASQHLVHVLSEPWTLEVRPTSAYLATGLVQRGRVVAASGLLLGLGIAALTLGLALRRRRQVESDLRLQLALDGARLGVWNLEVESGQVHLNDQWVHMLGYPPDQVRMDLPSYRALVHPDDQELVATAMEQHLEGRTEGYRTEHRLRAADGSWIWVLDTGRVVERDGAGRPRRVAGTQTDMTDMRQAEQELERSVARYQAIFENSPVGLLEQDMSAVHARFVELRAQGVEDLAAYFAADPERIRDFENISVVLDINPAYLELFGTDDIGQYRANLLAMVDERTREAFGQELVALFRGERTCELDVPLVGLDGQQLLYTSRLTVAPGFSGDLSSVLISLVDNTRRLREEEQRRLVEARQREAQKEESLALLAGGVAHDFNNLLVPIIGNIELAMQGIPTRSETADNLIRAERAAQRAAELARQMLTYSGRGQVKNHSFDLNDLVAEMSALLHSSLPAKVDLVTDFIDGTLAIEGDPTQLRQLVMNLVINGADAVRGSEGRVVVRTGRGRLERSDLSRAFLGEELVGVECAYLEVRDSGHGIDEETRKRIFEPFFSTKSAGRGLGMSVVLGIVRGHGGALVVTSREGQGTSIRVYFRESQEPLRPDLVRLPVGDGGAAPKPGAGAGARVLLADDEAPLRRFAVRALETIGAEVVAVCDGQEALDAFDPERFDLVLLDATMPRVGGIEAMEGIRLRSPGFPVVLSSGYTLEGVATRAAESPACWFLPKPYGVSELTQLVHQVMTELQGPDAT